MLSFIRSFCAKISLQTCRAYCPLFLECVRSRHNLRSPSYGVMHAAGSLKCDACGVAGAQLQFQIIAFHHINSSHAVRKRSTAPCLQILNDKIRIWYSTLIVQLYFSGNTLWVAQPRGVADRRTRYRSSTVWRVRGGRPSTARQWFARKP
jgi:hypothetical protein